MTQSRDTDTCAWARQYIDPFLDGELEGENLHAFEAHIGTCPSCRQELRAARSILLELRNMPELRCPRDVSERAIASVAGTPREDTSRWRARLFGGMGWMRPGLAGALVLIVVVAALLVRDEPQEQYTAAQVAEAQAELEWTFAYLNNVNRRSGLAVKTEVFGAGVVQPVQRAVRSAFVPESRSNTQSDGGSI